MSKNNSIVILGEGDFREQKNKFILATGQINKGYSFQFVSVNNGEYCKALEQVEKIIQESTRVSVYVFQDYSTTKDFKRRLMRNLNRRKARLRRAMERANAFFIDLKKGTTEDFFKVDTPDKKPVLKRRAA
ncbi:MAG: hypothetical protein MRY57_02640 [Candidatus Pacebacteria bacterium]|nr:hypothetical protein [Candidatus Paceibacterota bacterium]